MSEWNPSKYQMIMIPAEVLKVLGEKYKPHLIATYVGIVHLLIMQGVVDLFMKSFLL